MRLADDFYTIAELTKGDGELTARLQLNAGHAIFGGHFPGRPITPGAIILAIGRELLEYYCGRPLSLKKLPNVKYLTTLEPMDNPVRFTLSKIISEADDIHASVIVSDGDTVFTKFTMICC
jgi:3-hydroxyacyl-[acyl-carrier-protein] dehydratase